MAKKPLIIGEQEIKERTILEMNVDSKIISHTIRHIQEIELSTILGFDEYDKLMVKLIKWKNEGVPLDTYDDNLIKNYLIDFLCWGVLSNIFIPLHFKVTNSGVVTKNAEDSTTLDRGNLEYVKDFYDTKFDFYKQKLIKYLNKNGSNNTSVDSTSNSIPFYLDDGDYNQIELYEAYAFKTGYYRR